jgi:putative transposase
MRHTTFRFALDPTPAQEQMLAQHAGAARFAYNQCLRFVTDALIAKRTDPSVTVPWSGYDLINAFNTWKKSEDAGRAFLVAADGSIYKQVTALGWRHKVSAQVFEEAAVDLDRALLSIGARRKERTPAVRSASPGLSAKAAARQVPSAQQATAPRVPDPRRGRTSVIGHAFHDRSIRVYDDTRRLRHLLRPNAQVDPISAEQGITPRAKVLFATVTRRGTRWLGQPERPRARLPS